MPSDQGQEQSRWSGMWVFFHF